MSRSGWCEPGTRSRDHLVPRAKMRAGAPVLNPRLNTVAACCACNGTRAQMDAEEFRRRIDEYARGLVEYREAVAGVSGASRKTAIVFAARRRNEMLRAAGEHLPPVAAPVLERGPRAPLTWRPFDGLVSGDGGR